MAVAIAIETPLQDDVRGLVGRLNDHLLPLSPLEFQFKMTVEQMADSDTTLFVARDESGAAVGMGALKAHGPDLGEVKRMYTVLERIVGLARERGMKVVMLETGTGDGMFEAHRLYERYGFVPRGPFLDYPDSEWSAFFELRLEGEKAA